MTCAYFTEIGIRISIVDRMGLPAWIAGKNRHRFRVSTRARLRSGSMVGCVSSTWALPSTVTRNRATATRSTVRWRSESGISGIGLSIARALIVSVPLGGPCGPRSGGTAATGACVGGPADTFGEAVPAGAGTVAAAEGAAGDGSASTAGVGSRGASTRASRGDGVGRGVGGSARGLGGAGDRRAGGVGWVAGALAVTGGSMTWTSTGLWTTVGVEGCRSSKRNPICDRTVNRRASGNNHGNRCHGSSRNRIAGPLMRRALPRRRHREEEVLGAGPAGREHGLDHDAAGRRAVHRDHHVASGRVETGLERGREGVEGHRGLVEEDLALPGHGQR